MYSQGMLESSSDSDCVLVDSSVGVGVASSVDVGVSVSLMLLEAVDEELEELEAVDDPQAVRAEAVRAVARIRVTIFFFIDILLLKCILYVGYNIPNIYV